MELPKIGVWLSDTWRSYKTRLWGLLLVGGTGSAVGLLAGLLGALLAAVAWAAGLGRAGVACGLLVSVSAVLWIVSWAQAAMMESALSAEPLSLASAYRRSAGKVAAFSWVCILWFLALTGGLFLLILPGLILGVGLAWAPFVCVAEGDGGLAALERSLAYARGRWGATALRLFLIGVAASLPSAVPVIGPILGALAAPFALIGMAGLYRDLSRGREARPAPVFWGGRVLLGASALGLAIPLALAVPLVGAFSSKLPRLEAAARRLAAGSLDDATSQKVVALLQSGNPDGLSQAIELIVATPAEPSLAVSSGAAASVSKP